MCRVLVIEGRVLLGICIEHFSARVPGTNQPYIPVYEVINGTTGIILNTTIVGILSIICIHSPLGILL